MKEPEQYANVLIKTYYDEFNFDETYRGSKQQSILCAIIDVNNTIEAIECLTDKYYYKEVLTILKGKL